MYRRDRIAHNRLRKLWLPVNTLMGWEYLDKNPAGTTPIPMSLSQGNTTLAKTGDITTEIVSAPMTEADEIHTILPIPWDLNRERKVLGRIYFGHESATGDTGLIWKLGSLFFAKQAALSEIQANADTTTTFAAHTCGAVLDSLEVTDWNDLSWDDYITSTDILVGLALEFDTNGTAEDDECNLLGIELCYEANAFEDDGLPTIDNELVANSLY